MAGAETIDEEDDPNKPGKRVSWGRHVAEYASDDNGSSVGTEMSNLSKASVYMETLENNVGRAVTASKSGAGSTGSRRIHSSLGACLRTAGIEVDHSNYFSQGSTLPQNPTSSGLMSLRSSAFMSVASSTDQVSSESFTRLSEVEDESVDSVSSDWDQDLLRRFFGADRAPVDVAAHHVGLDVVVRNVFCIVDDLDPDSGSSPASQLSPGTPASVSSVDSHSSRSPIPHFLRQQARWLVTSRLFQNAYQVLTLYLIFGPSLANMFGNADTDQLFLFINTGVFALFIGEFCALALGRDRYLCSLVALLDLVALGSLVGDTWLDRGESRIYNEEGARVTRVARSARIMRLVRLAKIARAGRLLPRVLEIARLHDHALARSTFLKKVWRVFLYLDRDCDGQVTFFDLKILYLAVLQECEDMLEYASRQDLLREDLVIFEQSEADRGGIDDMTFDEFSRIFLSTKVGACVLRYSTKDVEEGSTVWSRTNRLSDQSAFQVCFLVLIIAVVTSVLEVDDEDSSTVTGLEQLTYLVRKERERGELDFAYVCAQVTGYARVHEVLLLVLDGLTLISDGQCRHHEAQQAVLDTFERARMMISDAGYRASELLQVCLPSNSTCSAADTFSMSLLDVKREAYEQHLSTTIKMALMVVLLVVFVMALEVSIQKYRKMIVNPLRALADEMNAMSVLEILTLEQDLECPVSEVKSDLQEFVELHAALESMRSAIRSWSIYVPPGVVERLLNRGIEATIGVARCNVTILFCDISGFEDACRSMDPQGLLALLSVVLGQIADVIEERHGTLLEFIADEVLAVFNTPNAIKHHAYAAVAAALDIHRIVDRLPPIPTMCGRDMPVRCRIGVHTGPVYVGNVGSKLRMKYGVLGDGVNLAARLKMLNTRYNSRTLVSSSVAENRACATMFLLRPVDLVAVKGKQQPTVVYEVINDVQHSSDALQEATAFHAIAFSLYREREFVQAASFFGRAARLFFAERFSFRLSCQLRRRCLTYAAHAPPGDWDGVERLNHKSWEEQGDQDEKELPADLQPALEPRQELTLAERQCVRRVQQVTISF